MKLFWKTSAVTEGNNCLFERNVVIKIERAWTIGKKLPQDAIIHLLPGYEEEETINN